MLASSTPHNVSTLQNTDLVDLKCSYMIFGIEVDVFYARVLYCFSILQILKCNSVIGFINEKWCTNLSKS